MDVHRDNFPNVEHYEFTETNLHSMNQLNALAQVLLLLLLSPPAAGARYHLPDHQRRGKPHLRQELATLRHLQAGALGVALC